MERGGCGGQRVAEGWPEGGTVGGQASAGGLEGAWREGGRGG